MAVMRSLTSPSPFRTRSRRSLPRWIAAAPTRTANRIRGSTSPSVPRLLPTNAPNRFRGMNISTTDIGVRSGCSARRSTCCAAAPPYSSMSRVRVSGDSVSPGATTFITIMPSATAIDMFTKNSRNVRPANGPSWLMRSSCAMPVASEAKTSGITTKKSIRRNTCPSGSSTSAVTLRAPSSTTGATPPTRRVTMPAAAPIARPRRIRFARRPSTSVILVLPCSVTGFCSVRLFGAGFLREAHADGAETRVDVSDLARDSVREIRTQESGRVAHVLERHVPAQRRDVRDAAQHLAKAGDAGGCQGLDRARGNAVHADVVRPQVRGEETHVGLEAGFGEPHDVVARDRLHGTEIRQHEDRARAARHQRLRRLGERGQAVARSEEHTSELQSRLHLVCRLLLEKK